MKQGDDMNTYTIEDIRSLRPCYDPTRYLPADWTGTLLDILAVEDCPAVDRLWVVIGLLDDSTRRLLSCQFVRRTPLADGRTVWDLLIDPRSRNAVEVTERFEIGNATEWELYAARDAALDAAWAAANDVARAAAMAAAHATSLDDGVAVAANVAWAAATNAANDAARDAALNAQIEIARGFVRAKDQGAAVEQ